VSDPEWRRLSYGPRAVLLPTPVLRVHNLRVDRHVCDVSSIAATADLVDVVLDDKKALITRISLSSQSQLGNLKHDRATE
jgi:hypothetical protein